MSRLSCTLGHFPSKRAKLHEGIDQNSTLVNTTPLVFFCSQLPWGRREEWKDPSLYMWIRVMIFGEKANWTVDLHQYSVVAPFRPSVSPLPNCPHPQQRLGFLSSRRLHKISTGSSYPTHCSVPSTASWPQDTVHWSARHQPGTRRWKPQLRHFLWPVPFAI